MMIEELLEDVVLVVYVSAVVEDWQRLNHHFVRGVNHNSKGRMG